MKKLVYTILELIVLPILVLAWVGSDPSIEIISPSGVGDADVMAVPVKIVVKQINTEQGIDYAKYFLVEDTNSDSTVSETEWTGRYQMALIPDVNQETSFTVGWLGKNKLTQEKYYFIIGVGVDLNGNASCDTNLIVGETANGGGASGIADKSISRFKAKGFRP